MIYYVYESHRAKAAALFNQEGMSLRTKERRAMPMYVTYADLIQLLIFIVSLVGLVYEILKDKRK